MDKIEPINVWYDNTAPWLEITWIREFGCFAPTEEDRLDVRIDKKGNVQGFMLTGIHHLKGQTHTYSLRQVAVDEKTWKAQHDKPIGSPTVVLPEYCGPADSEGIHFQADESGDCIEVRWGAGEGHYTLTGDDRVMALLDASGNVLGCRITGISQMGDGEKDFINVDLYPAKLETGATSAHPNP